MKASRGIHGSANALLLHGDNMNITERAHNLCDELYKTLTGKYGFKMVGDSYGWAAPGGYMIIDWQVEPLDATHPAEPDNLEELGEKISNIAACWGWQFIKLESEGDGYGDFYFKPLPIEEKKVEYNF